MAAFDEADVLHGVETGLGRLSRHGLEPFDDLFGFSREVMMTVLREWPYEMSGRFIQLFSENVAVAHASRLFYGESPLHKDEIVGFLGHCYGFFNSWKHDRP